MANLEVVRVISYINTVNDFEFRAWGVLGRLLSCTCVALDTVLGPRCRIARSGFHCLERGGNVWFLVVYGVFCNLVWV